MSLVVANTGDAFQLNLLCNKISPANLKLHLFKNNVTPAKSDTVATYTESTEAGYAAVTLLSSSWTINTVANVTTATYIQVIFTFTAAATVYGYYITDNTGTILIWAQAFPTSYTLPSNGGSVLVTPTITLN